MEEITVNLLVNGSRITARVPPDLTLLTFLREHLRLTGTKNGCAQGHCGACTVILDGEATHSCLIKMSRMHGRAVQTIEGLAQGGRLHPLQQAFVDLGAVQCGFCTPGMIMAAKALLDRQPSPSTEEIKRAIARNLCRCTGYSKIIQSIKAAAEILNREDYAGPVRLRRTPTGHVVGISVARKDALPKVMGEAKYADDIHLEGMLHGKVLWSAYPHAEILDVDASEAERTAGVRAVLTARDVPGVNKIGMLIRDQPAIADKKVRFIGDPVAVVFADDLKTAEVALEKIKVTYKELEGVFSAERASEPEAPLVHESGNLMKHCTVERGNIAEGFAQSDVIIEQSYSTPFVEHAYLETEAGVAAPTADGGVAIWIGTQSPFSDRDQLADALGLTKDKVRVVQLPMGGAFGAKEEISIHFFLALGALRTGRAVKMVLTRQESLRMHPKRHRFKMYYKIGATKDGQLLAIQAKIIADTGAYASLGYDVIEQATVFATGPYYWPNVRLDGYSYYTNNIVAGAMRGFGVPQVTFAVESQLDALARALGIDPFAFRERNALAVGLPISTGQVLEGSVGMKETLARVKSTLQSMPLPTPRPGWKLGIGLASGFKNVGLGLGNEDKAGAIVELLSDGHFRIRVGCADMGQGSATIMGQIAAEVLGAGFETIEVITGDTHLTPEGGPTTASRQSYFSGNAVLRASQTLRERISALVAAECGLHQDQVIIQNNAIKDTQSGRVLLSTTDLAALAASKGILLSAEHCFVGRQTRGLCGPAEGGLDRLNKEEAPYNYVAFSFATQAAIVEVDEDSGEVNVLKMIAAHDVGKALNPLNVEGQIDGGCVMGLGFALYEEFKIEKGFNLTNTLAKCRIPTSLQAPEIIPIIVEDKEPSGPFGAKGTAEMAALPTAGAIANAIYDAVGVRLTDLPATKDKIRQALRARRGY
ncbi:MAG: molybdopterin-dependent oxidoreductase [Chloroflexi bacterium]|nr:molybdopterin-dependent oxidoreductase [Chloroflexota bacterium]MCL5074879.1 molybdopterin-dependent oxidoreductase [Chloroflexota bacterium]